VPEQTRQPYGEEARPSYGEVASGPDAVLAGAANGARTTLLDGEDPPFDLEAT
jgi:hypothetical protein